MRSRSNRRDSVARTLVLVVALLSQLGHLRAAGATFYVDASIGNDANPGTSTSLPWKTIQKAFNAATPGSTVYIKAGTYSERLTLNVSGSAAAGFTTFRNLDNDLVILDATAVTANRLIDINAKSYVRIQGLDIRNYINDHGIAVGISNGSDHIEIRNNKLSNIKMAVGTTREVIANGIGAWNLPIRITGNHPTRPNDRIIIDGNEITNCEEGQAETISVTSNSINWEITNNRISGCHKFIDAGGFYGDSPDPATDQARNGLIRGNVVSDSGVDGVGIYIDGGKDIIIERNTLMRNPFGVVVTCEHQGKMSSGIIVRDNLMYDNTVGGISIGGWTSTYGTVVNSSIVGNTFVNNGYNAVQVMYASNISVTQNLMSETNVVFTTIAATDNTNSFDYNFYQLGNRFATVWKGVWYGSLATYKQVSGQDANSTSGNPLFVNAGAKDFHLSAASPAINRGNPNYVAASGELDLDGNLRVAGGRVDVGAFEYGSQSSSPAVSVGVADVSLFEGNSGTTNFAFAVTLSGVSNQPVSVNYTTADGTATVAAGDYVSTSGTLTFPPGTLTQQVVVPVIGNLANEVDETFAVNLSGAVNATISKASGIGTIVNDDAVPSLTINDVSMSEGQSGTGNLAFTVTLSAASGKTVSVNYATADGSATVAGNDYAAASGTVTFPPGSTSQQLLVGVKGDTVNEPNEAFAVNLTGAVNASIAKSQGVGTIVNDDALPVPSLAIDDVSLSEGQSGTTNFSFTVTLSASSTQTVSVNYATSDGGATVANGDYTAASGTLTFPPGTTTRPIVVSVKGDTANEPNETFAVNLSGAVNATIAKAQGLGTILNDDALPSISISDVSLQEGQSGTTSFSFAVTLSAPSNQTVSVSYATADGTATVASGDYVAASGTVTFSPGTTTQPVVVGVKGDTANEANETFFVNLTGASNATLSKAQGVGTIVNDDAALPAGWWDGRWANRRKIMIDNSAASTALTDFPLLVTLTPSTIDYAKTLAGGADIRFVDADNVTVLSHEIDGWQSGGSSRVWVRVPRVANTAAGFIWVYYNNPAAADGQSRTTVWDASFRAVYHLRNSGTLNTTDSTAIGNNLTATAGVTSAAGAGAVGDAATLDGGEGHGLSRQGFSLGTSSVTAEFWISQSNYATSQGILLVKETFNTATGWGAFYENGGMYLRGGSTAMVAAYTPPSGGWHHVVFTIAGSTGTFYVDGAMVATGAVTPITDSSNALNIGDYSGAGYNLNALVDEVRVSNAPRSADWIRASYLTASNRMTTIGAEESR